RPRLRPHLGIAAEDRSGERFVLYDELRLSPALLRLNIWQLDWVQRFDGTRTLRALQQEVMRELGGQLVPLEIFQHLAEVLDEALFLDSPRWQEIIARPVRPPSCIGAYEGDRDDLRRQIHDLFLLSGGSGLPGEVRPDDDLRAILAPHIDYARGGVTYTH